MNKFNPLIHHRRSIRLKGYDYSRAGLYFITICCQDRICRFGHVENMEMILNEYGMVTDNEWIKLPDRFPNFKLDVFQIMPNHMHGIIFLQTGGATLAVVPNDDVTPNTGSTPNDGNQQNTIEQNAGDIRAGASPAPTVSNIVGAYKLLVANSCLEIYKFQNETMGKLWQRNYYQHIIRDEQAYRNISEYIKNNPANS